MIKYLGDKAFNIAKNPNYHAYQHGLASMVYKCLDKKFAWLADKPAFGGVIKNDDLSKK